MADADPTPLPGTDRKLFARFMAKAVVTDGCWQWTASRYPNGYGQFGTAGTTRRAHRIS